MDKKEMPKLFTTEDFERVKKKKKHISDIMC